MLVFSNPGIIDPRAITTFGVSAKVGDNAIGYFGTGLKYAIAILLRNGHQIRIHTPSAGYSFEIDKATIRDKEFGIIVMTTVHWGRGEGEQVAERQPLGFTTDLGKNWELWQAFRELYCNCVDEQGKTLFVANNDFDEIQVRDNTTQVIVTGLDKIWADRHEIILATEPIYVCREAGVEVHASKSKYVYYKGIRVHELPQLSEFTYNLVGKVELTEDRTVASVYDMEAKIKSMLAMCRNEEVLDNTLRTSRYESDLDFSYCTAVPGELFKAKVQEIRKLDMKNLNQSALRLVTRYLPPVDAYPEIKLDDVDQARMERAITFCRDMGIPVDEFPISVHESLGDAGIMGKADVLQKRILITRLAFTMGTKQVASTLIEEWVHIKHGYQDHSRAMQNYLFDSWLSLAERHYGTTL